MQVPSCASVNPECSVITAEPPAPAVVKAPVPAGWEASFPVVAARLQSLDTVLTRPLTPADRLQARTSPYYQRGDWQDTLAFGARSSWRRASRYAAAGQYGKSLAYRAAAGLGFLAYMGGGALATIPAGIVHKEVQAARRSVYSKPRTDDGVREDMIGRTLSGLRNDVDVGLTSAMTLGSNYLPDVRAAQTAAMRSLLGLTTQLLGQDPRLRCSKRIAGSVAMTDGSLSRLGAALGR